MTGCKVRAGTIIGSRSAMSLVNCRCPLTAALQESDIALHTALCELNVDYNLVQAPCV